MGELLTPSSKNLGSNHGFWHVDETEKPYFVPCEIILDDIKTERSFVSYDESDYDSLSLDSGDPPVLPSMIRVCYYDYDEESDEDEDSEDDMDSIISGISFYSEFEGTGTDEPEFLERTVVHYPSDECLALAPKCHITMLSDQAWFKVKVDDESPQFLHLERQEVLKFCHNLSVKNHAWEFEIFQQTFTGLDILPALEYLLIFPHARFADAHWVGNPWSKLKASVTHYTY